MSKQCVLYDRECIDCGECDRCDLDPNKICDNCMRCVNGDQDYRSILIDEVRVNNHLTASDNNGKSRKN